MKVLLLIVAAGYAGRVADALAGPRRGRWCAAPARGWAAPRMAEGSAGDGGVGGGDIRDMIQQLEAEGFAVDERITEERVNVTRIEAIVRQEADAKFDAATRELKELASEMKGQSDDEAKATYERFKEQLLQREAEAKDRLRKLEELTGGMEQVQEDARLAKEQVEQLASAKDELRALMSSPQGQLAAFKFKSLPQQVALGVGIVAMLLLVDSTADLLAALPSGQLQGPGVRAAAEAATALGASAFYGIWSGEVPPGALDDEPGA